MLFLCAQEPNASPRLQAPGRTWRSGNPQVGLSCLQLVKFQDIALMLYRCIVRYEEKYILTFSVSQVGQQSEENAYILEITIKTQSIKGRSCVAVLLCRLQGAHVAHWAASFPIQPRSLSRRDTMFFLCLGVNQVTDVWPCRLCPSTAFVQMENIPEGFPNGVKYTKVRLVLQYSLVFCTSCTAQQMNMTHIGAEKQGAFQSGLFLQLVMNISGNLI